MTGTGATHLEQADCDVLVVGAGPTGLALAAQLLRFGATVRVVDAAESAVKESRALVLQARTLEVLRPFGVTELLVDRGNPAARLRVHAGSRVADIPLFDIGADDTAYPYLLFLSQAETETVLEEHLASAGVRVERSTRVEGVRQDSDTAVCVLRRPDGTTTEARARWVAGCDGFRSAVRTSAGIDFVGGRYPQTFLLADLDADGLEEGLVHGFLTGDGPLLFFPLRRPAAWRLVVVRPGPEALDPSPVTLSELQALADDATGGTVTLRQPVWATRFRVHHRQATAYRRGRVLLAGDAAHVHSPAGGQGMNTGIQDAVNLGWKLALVARGLASPALLDTYDAERRPVGAFVLRFTDRAFRVVTWSHPVLRAARTHLVPRVLPVALRVQAARALAFRTVSQLRIRYPDGASGRLRRRSPAAVGDRLPDAPLSVSGATTSLHELTAPPAYHLLLLDAGSSDDAWDWNRLADLRGRYAEVLTIHRIVRSPQAGPLPDTPLPDTPLRDDTGLVRRRLAASPGTGVLVRPDGHIGCRVEGHRLDAASEHLARWLPSP